MSESARSVSVRDARDDDMAAVQAIYAHHVLRGLATFDEVPPLVDELPGHDQGNDRPDAR